MATPRKSHRLYRALLHLYPASHRQAYGEQMVQTLQDSLDDQRHARGRFVVWLRVVAELPINIIEENIHNSGGVSVNKLTKISNKRLVIAAAVVALLIAGSYVIMAVIWHNQRSQINTLNQQLRVVNDNQAYSNSGAYKAATIIPGEAVYLPLAKLKLADTPLNDVLVYDYKPTRKVPGMTKELPAQLDVSTHDLTINSYSTTRQFDCTQVVYADFVSPSYPLNPKYKSRGSVALADGRTMNVYYAESIPGCQIAWEANDVDPIAIADALKAAASY
jgi:hypothetical protein